MSVRLGLCTSPPCPIPAEHVAALKPQVLRSVLYTLEDLDELVRVAPQGRSLVLCLNTELDLVGQNWHGWEQALRAIVGRAGSRILAVECGNELDIGPDPETWGHAPSFGADLARRAAPILRASGVKCVLSSVAGKNWQPWIEQAAAQAGDAIDGVAFHPYGQRPDGWGSPGWGFGDLRPAIARAFELGGGKPVWLTELGVNIGDAGGEQRQADWLRAAVGTVRALGEQVVPCVAWFAWHDGVGRPDERGPTAFGLVEEGSERQRPAYAAYQSLREQAPSPLPFVDDMPPVVRDDALNHLTVPVADRHSLPPRLLLALTWAESTWRSDAERWATARTDTQPARNLTPEAKAAISARDRAALQTVLDQITASGSRDVSFGCGQQTVSWAPDGDKTLTVENCLFVRRKLFDAEYALEVAAKNIAPYWRQEGDALNALCRYNKPNLAPSANPARGHYAEGLRQADLWLAANPVKNIPGNIQPPKYQFVHGFKALADQIGPAAGVPLMDQAELAPGTVYQQTDKGLLFWSQRANVPQFYAATAVLTSTAPASPTTRHEPTVSNRRGTLGGVFAAMPEGVCLHGSRSGQEHYTTLQEFTGTANYAASGIELGWNITVGDDMLAVHLGAGEWGHHARAASDEFLSVEFAQAVVGRAISDAQVRAFCWWLRSVVLVRWPLLEGLIFQDPARRLPTHATLEALGLTGQRDGKTDVFPDGDGRADELRARIIARLKDRSWSV